MMNIIIPLAVIAGLLVVIVGAGFVIKSKISKFSRQAFGTDNLMEGYREQKRKLSETPRSVQSMTSIYGPEILRDFPDFDLELYRDKAKNVVRGYLNAIATGSAATLPEEVTQTLQNSVTEIIENLNANGQKQYYLEPVIHACEIGRYIKSGGLVTIRFNTSVGVLAYLEDVDTGKILNGSKDEKLQTLFEVDLIYLQDADVMGVYGESLGLNCPNCGAPIRNLGQKFCAYCGTGVIEVNTRVWKFNAVREQTTRRTAF